MFQGKRVARLILIGILLTGCGSNLPKTIRVHGRVTYDGQPPPGPGTVYFLPTEPAEGFPTRPAMGDYDKTGNYKVTTFEPGDGLMPGKYIMHIESWESPPNMEGKPVKSFVPKKYQSALTSGFTLEITPKMKPQEVNLDMATK